MGLSTFTFCTLNGFYKDQHHDIAWHQHGKEESQHSSDSLSHKNTLLFGRKTYEMMVNFWPTPSAVDTFPEVAAGMNHAEKLIVSMSLVSTNWNNTRILGSNWLEELAELKKSKNITLLGSGSILTQLAEADLIDEFQFMVDPVVIGKGTSIFQGIDLELKLDLIDKKIFNSGKVLLTYKKMK